MRKLKLSAKDIVLIALFAAILTLQEELLTFIPNVSLTVFLIVLYSKVFGMYRTLLILVIHVFLDNLVMSSFSPVFTPFMYIGWALIPILLNTVFKRVEKALPLALLGVLFSFLYCWVYVIPNVLILGVDARAYLVADFYFEIVLAVTSFITILWLYDPVYKVTKKFANID